jgi:hypothetical protein
METTYRDAALALWGEAGGFVHDEYADYRDRYFTGRVPEQVPIVIGITAYGHCGGLTRGTWDYGPRITIESRQFSRGATWVSHIILHEMVHVALRFAGLDPDHKGEPWYSEVRQLSLALFKTDLSQVIVRGADRKSVRVPNPDWTGPGCGVPRTVVRKQRVADSFTHGDIARWPHSFAEPSVYEGEPPIPCPSY